MARTKGKTEHAGAKNGGGAMWGRRAEVKDDSNKRRRAASKKAVKAAWNAIPLNVVLAAEIFEAQETIRANMTKQRTTDEIARMSGNDTVARMID